MKTTEISQDEVIQELVDQFNGLVEAGRFMTAVGLFDDCYLAAGSADHSSDCELKGRVHVMRAVYREAERFHGDENSDFDCLNPMTERFKQLISLSNRKRDWWKQTLWGMSDEALQQFFGKSK